MRGRVSPPGLQDRTKGETNTTDFIKEGGTTLQEGVGGAPRRGGHTRNEEVDIEKWFVWVTWLQTQEAGITLISKFRQK